VTEVWSTRSSDWDYIVYLSIGVGASLTITGSAALLYLQERALINQRYASLPLPIVFVGICFIAFGMLAFIRRGGKARMEQETPPPPPPPLPP
jgi:hypothetical protein